MLTTTTSTLQGREIKQHLGIVTGEAVMGANLVKDFLANIRDAIGGRSKTYERELGGARKIALREMEQEAIAIGANAIIGVDLDYEVLGANNGMLMVTAAGTAVIVEGEPMPKPKKKPAVRKAGARSKSTRSKTTRSRRG